MKRFEGDRSDLVLGKFNGALEFIVETLFINLRGEDPDDDSVAER